MILGTKFSELSYALYDKIGVVLFALQITGLNLFCFYDYISSDQQTYTDNESLFSR